MYTFGPKVGTIRNITLARGPRSLKLWRTSFSRPRSSAFGRRTGAVAGSDMLQGSPDHHFGRFRIVPQEKGNAPGWMGATPCLPRAPALRTPHPLPCRVSPRAVMPIARLPYWWSFTQKQKLHKQSPLSPPIHAQISADLSAALLSGGCVFLWQTIP